MLFRSRYVTMLLFRKKGNSYELLFFVRSGDKKLMTPGGNVSIIDVYDDKGEKYEDPCYRGLLRESREEFGHKLPKFNVKKTFVYQKVTKIYICETQEKFIKFKPNDEAIGLKWVNAKEINKQRLVHYVKKSIDQMISMGILKDYLK